MFHRFDKKTIILYLEIKFVALLWGKMIKRQRFKFKLFAKPTSIYNCPLTCNLKTESCFMIVLKIMKNWWEF